MTLDPLLARVALGLVAGAATFLLLTGGRLPLVLPRPFGRAVVARWVTIVAGAGVEEVVWRAICLGGLLPVVGPWPALTASSVGFSLWHVPSLGGRCLVHLLTGAVFGAVFLAGGLVAAIVAHALYNLLVDWAVHAEHARLRGP